MSAILICPVERSEVGALSERDTLANLRLFGNPLIHYWLEHLAARGMKEVKILAADRPEELRAFIGTGERWGLRADVIPQSHEPTCREAVLRHNPDSRSSNAVVIDHLPGFPQQKLFDSYSDFFRAIQSFFQKNAGTAQIGMKEIRPGIWVGLRTQISPGAILKPPCWIGENVLIKSGAEIGPRAFIENCCVVENGAEISESWIAAETFVGSLTRVQNSLAVAETLINHATDSFVKIPDAFLLCGLNERNHFQKTRGILGRAAALAVLSITAPFALISMWKAHRNGQNPLRPRHAAAPNFRSKPTSILYYELTSAHSWWKRWPQLWNVAKGEFNWIGNRPLTPLEAGKLNNDFERLWLAAPIGLISQADAEGCADLNSDEARAHASFYSTQANWRLNFRIFVRALKRLLTRTIAVPSNQEAGEIKDRSFTLAAR
jgi:hypothetical protein